jgi:hypothetical protein
MLIISLRKLSNTQKNNLKKYYKTIVFDQRLHLRKNIKQLTSVSDVVIVELNLSRVFSITRNLIYLWLKEQNILDIPTAFIYESSKYKGLFKDHVNWFCRKLPLLFDRELEKVIDDQSYLDQETKSIYRPEPDEPDEEVHEEEVKITGLEHIQKQIDDVIERLKKLENKEDPCNTPVNKDHKSETKNEPEPEPEPVKKVYLIKQSTKKYIVLCNDEIIKEFSYKNGIEKRKAKHQAEKYLSTCK